MVAFASAIITEILQNLSRWLPGFTIKSYICNLIDRIPTKWTPPVATATRILRQGMSMICGAKRIWSKIKGKGSLLFRFFNIPQTLTSKAETLLSIPQTLLSKADTLVSIP